MDPKKCYLICYKPKSYKGCHKQKLVETYPQALKFMEKVQKKGSTVYYIYTPSGEIVYDWRLIYENLKNNGNNPL